MADLRMPDINKVQLAGRLTRDPELKYIASGTALCKLGMAVSKKYKTKSGEMKEDTLFINVTVWDKAAEWIAQDCKKGTAVLVDGELKMDSWEDKTTGQKRTTLEVRAFRVQQLAWADRGDQGNQGGQGGGGGYQEAPKPRVIEEPIPEDDIPF